jgi:hypothetical protein
MSIILIEGFEQFNSSFDFSWSALSEHLLALNPDINAASLGDWFADTAPEPFCDTAQQRIAGKSLKFTRSAMNVADDSSLWDAVYGANLGFGFKNRKDICVGFGLLYDKQPDSSIPIVQFRWDAGEGEQEQMSLWLSPSGKLFCSAVDYQHQISSQAIPVVIAELATAAGAYRFGVWNYIECYLVYSEGNAPTLTLSVNGTIVLEAQTSLGLVKQSQQFISSVHIINPPNTYFTGGYEQWIDDLYITDRGTGILGPQQVSQLTLGALVTNEWPTGNVSSGNYVDDTTFAQSETLGQENVYLLNGVPTGVDNITAIALTVLAAGSASALRFGFIDPTSGLRKTAKQGLDSGGGTEMLRYTEDVTLPGDLAIDVAGVEAVNVFFENVPIVGS